MEKYCRTFADNKLAVKRVGQSFEVAGSLPLDTTGDRGCGWTYTKDTLLRVRGAMGYRSPPLQCGRREGTHQ